MEVQTPVQQSYPKESVQNALISGRNALVPAQRIQTQLSISDVAVSLANAMKSADSFHVSSSVLSSQNITQKPQLPIPSNPVLMSKEEAVRVATPTVPKEMINTPPATPRPHSSDSFFQLSSSPQSQLLASLDSHSQPTPASTKIGTTSPSTLGDSTKLSPAIVPSTADLNMATKMALQQQQRPLLSPKPQQLQQFALQQNHPLSSASIVKQLSQYKETFGSISNAHAARNLLSQEKPIEQQNIERFLQDGQLTMSYPNKVTPPQNQQLRDLLQNKKFCEPGMDGGGNGNYIFFFPFSF